MDSSLKMRKRLLLEVLTTRWTFRVLMVVSSFVATLLGLVAPLLQKRFLESYSDWPSMEIPFLPTSAPAPLTLFLSFLTLATSLILNQWVNRMGIFEAIHMNQQWGRRMYQKMVSLKPFDWSHKKPLGETIAVYTGDIPGATILLEQSLPQALGILFPLILTPLLLVHFYHVPPVFLACVLIGILIINFGLAYRQSTFFDRFKRLAAERVGSVSEWIQNIRLLRILGWVESFESKIFKQRIIETKNRIQMLNNGQTMNAVSSSTAFLLNIALLSLFTWSSQTPLEQKMSPAFLLSLLWIVGVFLTRPFRQLPWFFTFVFDAWTSLKRVADVFAIPTREPILLQKVALAESSATILEVKNLSLHVDSKKLLDQISFQVFRNEWIAIVGEVGSGKTLLLQSLLLETPASFEVIATPGGENLEQWIKEQVMLVPQEGFLISANIRDNIQFSYRSTNEDDSPLLKYLDRAQFKLDNEVFSQGLETLVGERGVNLSGGQKQRLGLARVQAFNRPVLLFDDPLSALDIDTEEKIVTELFQGALKNKTRIMTTHRFSVLPFVDRIFFLQEGRLVAQGDWKTLWETNAEFRELTESYKETTREANYAP